MINRKIPAAKQIAKTSAAASSLRRRGRMRRTSSRAAGGGRPWRWSRISSAKTPSIRKSPKEVKRLTRIEAETTVQVVSGRASTVASGIEKRTKSGVAIRSPRQKNSR